MITIRIPKRVNDAVDFYRLVEIAEIRFNQMSHDERVALLGKLSEQRNNSLRELVQLLAN